MTLKEQAEASGAIEQGSYVKWLEKRIAELEKPSGDLAIAMERIKKDQAHIAELEGEVKRWIQAALRWEKRARELLPKEEEMTEESHKVILSQIGTIRELRIHIAELEKQRNELESLCCSCYFHLVKGEVKEATEKLLRVQRRIDPEKELKPPVTETTNQF